MMNAIIKRSFCFILLLPLQVALLHAQNCSPSFSYLKKQKEVYFTNTTYPGGNTGRFYWNYGDGSVVEKNTAATMIHSYANPGTYIVSLIDSLCPTFIRKTDTVIVSQTQLFQPDFSYTSIGNGQVVFYDESTPQSRITSLYWDFGDGLMDKAPTPIHSFLQNGAYRVCLSVFDNNNNFDFTCDTLLITDAISCKAGFTAQYVNGQYEFSNYSFSSDTAVMYEWTFGDGFKSWEKNPTHKYMQAGTYIAALTLHGNPCVSSTSSPIVVPDTAVCKLSLAKTISDQRLRLILFDKTTQPLTQYFIDYGDGQSETVTSNITEHIYSSLGTYIVTVNTIGSTCGIEIISRDTIKITSEVPICKANFDMLSTGLNSSLYNSSYVYGSQRSSEVSISWGDGSSYTGIDSVNFHHAYAKKGLYTISLIIRNSGGCSDSVVKVVGIGPTNILSGSVFAGNDPAAFASIRVFAYEAYNGTLNSFGFISVNYDGSFSVELPQGYYLIQADFPFNPQSGNSFFLPTYYRNKQNWNGADVVSLNTNRSDIDINLIPSMFSETGTGRISGRITYGEGMGNESGQIPFGSPVNKMLVFLINDEGLTVAYTHSNADGEFNFEKIPYGNYQVWGEMAGKNTIPAYLTITDSKPDINGVSIIVGKYTVTTGMNRLIYADNSVSLYPNPAINELNINNRSNNIQTVNIFDVTGKMLKSIATSVGNECSIDISGLSNGLYYLQALTDIGTVESGRFIKMGE